MSKIVFLGDSNTAAYYVTQTQAFAHLLGTAWGFDDIVNAGVVGDKASDMLARLDADVIDLSPDVCVIMAGTNEMAAAYVNDTPNATMIASYVTNMEDIIDGLQAEGIGVIVFSPIPSRRAEEAYRWPAMIRALRELCDQKGIVYVPVHEAFVRKADDEAAFKALYREIQVDFYHLNEDGHAFLADVAALYVPVVSEPDPPEDPPPDPEEFVIFEATLNLDSTGYNGYTRRQVIEASALDAPAFTPTEMRITWQASSTGALHITAGAVGHKAASGDPYDFSAPPTSLTPLNIAQGEFGGDWFEFAWDKVSGLVISAYTNGGAGNDQYRAANGVPGCESYSKSGSDATTVNASGYSAAGGVDVFIRRIEVR